MSTNFSANQGLLKLPQTRTSIGVLNMEIVSEIGESRTSRNSAQPSRLDRTPSSARAILDNTDQENNNEMQDYFHGAGAMSRRTKLLRRHAAKHVLSAYCSYR